MKKVIAVVVIIFAAFVVGRASQGSRFELLDRMDTGKGYYLEAWHDKGSGIEFICSNVTPPQYGNGISSCFPTGRKW